MQTKIIDGRQIASALHDELRTQVAALHRQPRLAVIIVGYDPASQIYVRNKARTAAKIGIHSVTIRLDSDTSEAHLLSVIDDCHRTGFDGIMVQLPLPPHINRERVLQAIDPVHDVDGFHPLNVGQLTLGGRRNVPCTPKGIMHLLDASETVLHGAKAVVVGASPIVGKPVSALLLQAGATVTTTHRATRDLAAETRVADIIVVAAGCPDLIRADMIKPGATIIDVGINRRADGTICGDVAYDECLGIAGAITPVPGGVGPMTIACLMQNTVEAVVSRP